MNWLTISQNRRRTSMDYLQVTNAQNTRWHEADARIAEKAPINFPSADLPISLPHSIWPCSLVPQVVIDGVISRFSETHFHQSQTAKDVLQVSSRYSLWSNAFWKQSIHDGSVILFSSQPEDFSVPFIYLSRAGMQECHLEGGGQRITRRDLEIKSLLPLCGSGDSAQVMSTGSKYLYRLSHLTRP